MNLMESGSNTAKMGFQNEKDACKKFNNWKNDKDSQSWLKIMQYKIDEIEYVKANIIHGEKADINVQIQIKLKKNIDTENLQVKLVSNLKGYNQIDKRWLSHYQKLWSIPPKIFMLLQFFTGEIKPYKKITKDPRRMFIDEFFNSEKTELINWFSRNKLLIISDIIKGRGKFCAEWVLVIRKINSVVEWALKNINEVLQHYSHGNVRISPKGSIIIGKITMQRKGGDGGRRSANMLQFKLDPTEIFKI